MPFDISQLGYEHEFDLDTNALGKLRCRSVNDDNLSKLGQLPTKDINGLEFARQVLALVSKRYINGAILDETEVQQEKLSQAELSQIRDEEVETFAREFVAHNEWLFDDAEGSEQQTDNTGQKKEDTESHSDYLVRIFRPHMAVQGQRMTMIGQRLAKLGTKLYQNATLDSMRRALDLSDSLRSAVSTFNQAPPLPTFGADKFYEYKQPISPINETNRHLDTVVEHLRDIRPLVSKSVELINTLADTTLKMQADFISNARSTQKYALTAIVIATFSFLVSAVFSGWSYYDAIQREQETTKILKHYQQENQTVIQAQNARHEELIRSLLTEFQNLNQQKRNKPVTALKAATNTVKDGE